MVALANISDKSIHPQEGLDKQKKSSSSISLTSSHKFGHNSAVIGCTIKCLRHLVPHVILHLMIYRLLILKKWLPMGFVWKPDNRRNSRKDFIASLPVSSLAYSINIYMVRKPINHRIILCIKIVLAR